MNTTSINGSTTSVLAVRLEVRAGSHAEGRNPCQERVLAYVTQGLSRGLGRPATIPTHIGRVGRVPSSRVPPTPHSPLCSPHPLCSPSLQLIPLQPALAWMDQRVRKGMGSSLRELAGHRSRVGLESPSQLPGLEPGPLQQGFLKILYLH